jgi:trk system potassium uptake protein
MALTVLVVGGGRVGLALARLLTEATHTVVVIEPRPDRVERLGSVVPAARGVIGDGRDPAVLEAAGIRQVDVVAAVTADDPTNLVVTALARSEFEVPRTIARIVDPAHAWLFDDATGVDVAVDQAALLAGLIAEEMSMGEVATLLKLRRGAFSLVEEQVAGGSRAVGRAVADLELPPDCVLVGVLRDDEVLASHGGLVLQAGDEVLAVVHVGAAAALAAALRPPEGTGDLDG